MKRIIIAGLLAGLVVFIWSSISWMALPFHGKTLHTIPDEALNLEVMDEQMTVHGVYHYPGMGDKEAMKADPEKAMAELTEKHARGPRVAFMVFLPGGGPIMYPMTFITGLLIYVIAGWIAAYLLSVSTGKMKSFKQRVLFVTLLGVFATLFINFGELNWWFFPVDYTMLAAIDSIISWFLAGLVIAWRIQPE